MTLSSACGGGLITMSGILVLEDEPIIALDIEDMLQTAGFDRIHTYRTCQGALAFLNEQSPSVALVDLILSDGPSIEIVNLLRQKGVPFAIYSGMEPDRSLYGKEILAQPWIAKPASHKQLLDFVSRALTSA